MFADSKAKQMKQIYLEFFIAEIQSILVFLGMQDQLFSGGYKPSFTAFGNKQWWKGGMTHNGLKEASQVRNYLPNPGRSNLIPDPTQSLGTTTGVVSSIGAVQTNGLGQVAASRYGPGTLLSTQVGVTNPAGLSYNQIGVVEPPPNKMTFVDYRSTNPVLVDNLRKNPLSIYAQTQAVKESQVPPFFAYIQPSDYADYKNEMEKDISKETKELYIDNSPNVSILGLATQNPFLGLGRAVPNEKPQFLGKVYGGPSDSSAESIARNIYNQGWTQNVPNPDPALNFEGVETFQQNPQRCQNKALVNFSQGYNVAPQIVDNAMVVEGPHANNNLPWGPRVVTGNPQTQQGGVWQRGQNPPPTKWDKVGIRANKNAMAPQGHATIHNNFVNPYKNGLPGTLIA